MISTNFGAVGRICGGSRFAGIGVSFGAVVTLTGVLEGMIATFTGAEMNNPDEDAPLKSKRWNRTVRTSAGPKLSTISGYVRVIRRPGFFAGRTGRGVCTGVFTGSYSKSATENTEMPVG